jgi:pyruvate/2-oxoglutarate dehydrogenase complex dihydrolipoamide acyltransferase (E2) component
VISRPQSANHGTYAVIKQPWVIHDELGKDALSFRPTLTLARTDEQRVVDGAYTEHAHAERLQSRGVSGS